MDRIFKMQLAFSEGWMKTSEFYKKVKEVIDACDDYFPKYELDLGIMTNELQEFCSQYMWGCLVERKFVDALVDYLIEYDIVHWRETPHELDEENSNGAKVAKLLNELRDMAQYYKPWEDVRVMPETEKAIIEWINEGEEHEDYSLIERLDYMRWVTGGHNIMRKEIPVSLCTDYGKALFFSHELYCCGIVFHGYKDDGYQQNGSVMLSPSCGWQQHT